MRGRKVSDSNHSDQREQEMNNSILNTPDGGSFLSQAICLFTLNVQLF